MIRVVVARVSVLVATAAAYGFAIGSAHSWLYASRNLVKFPLLVFGTGVVCSLAYFVAARFLGMRIGFSEVQRVALGLFRDTSVLLGSLALPVFLVGRQLASEDDGWLGEYGMFLAWNVLLIGMTSTFALVRQIRRLEHDHSLSVRKARVVAASWLVMSLLIGGQLAFWLRPFFGFPATRHVEGTPFMLGSRPDARGATNFYEAIGQIACGAPLPTGWKRR